MSVCGLSVHFTVLQFVKLLAILQFCAEATSVISQIRSHGVHSFFSPMRTALCHVRQSTPITYLFVFSMYCLC